jgi:serine protease Do
VRIQDVTQDVADAMGLDKATGALITDVPDGPAKEAGLATGDVILSFDGVEVADTRGLIRQVGNSAVGATVRVTVLRDGKSQTVKVVLGRREDADAAAEATPQDDDEGDAEPLSKLLLGLTLTPLTETLREELGADAKMEGLVVTQVDEASEAFEKGLRAGDIITEAGQQKVTSISALEARVAAAKDAGRKSLLLLVRRAGDPRFVALSLEE